MAAKKLLPVWWNREIVDFVTLEEAEKAIVNNPNGAKKIRYKGKDGVEREGLLITTPVMQWRTLR